MIELTKVTGEKFSVHVNSITYVGIQDGDTKILIGGWAHFVKESYEEVLQMIKGDGLETK